MLFCVGCTATCSCYLVKQYQIFWVEKALLSRNLMLLLIGITKSFVPGSSHRKEICPTTDWWRSWETLDSWFSLPKALLNAILFLNGVNFALCDYGLKILVRLLEWMISLQILLTLSLKDGITLVVVVIYWLTQFITWISFVKLSYYCDFSFIVPTWLRLLASHCILWFLVLTWSLLGTIMFMHCCVHLCDNYCTL